MLAVLRRFWWLGLVALALAYAFLAHYTNTRSQAGSLGAALALAPFAVLGLSLAWNSRHRGIMLLLLCAAAALLLAEWETVTRHFSHLFWIEHAGTQLALCLGFARSLMPGREPVCTYFARLVHGTLSLPLERYTRSITVLWTCFFGLMAAASTVLFHQATLAAWSTFANFFTGPLIVAMFILEYLARRILLPNMRHAHILDAVKLYWKTPAR